MTWVSDIDLTVTNSDGWVDGTDVGVYVCHAGNNTDTDAGTDPVLEITVEYSGVS